MSSTGEQIFSGGVDGTIQSWNTPSLNTDPYDPYGMLRDYPGPVLPQPRAPLAQKDPDRSL